MAGTADPLLYVPDMGRTTQRVDPSALDVLIEHPPRAAIAFPRGNDVEVAPIVFQRIGGRFWIGIDRELLTDHTIPLAAVVLLDDGRYWFELRAITWRGCLVSPSKPPPTLPGDLVWFEFLVEGSVCWDYATLHEEP